MTETVPELPDRAEVDEAVKLVNDHAQRIFLWNYERSRGQLVTLYNKAMASQWNSVTIGSMPRSCSPSTSRR